MGKQGNQEYMRGMKRKARESRDGMKKKERLN